MYSNDSQHNEANKGTIVMTDNQIKDFLNSIYSEAMNKASGKDTISSNLPQNIQNSLNTILLHSENSKAVLAVTMTSLVYKHFNPCQDIRKHQQSIEGGYSGRTFDTKFITPFLKENRFPAMSTSGWLTRSLEQKVPYDYNYTGAIKPAELKTAFLNTMNTIETDDATTPEDMLDYLLQGLIIMRDKHNIHLARPQNLSIDNIIELLNKHFHEKYSAEGASRLPVLAIYAVYECLINEIKRFENKKLLPLENHTSADSRSGRIGDIDITDDNGATFEAVEIKFNIPIDHNIIEIAIEKIQPVPTVERYYLLSTCEVSSKETIAIEQDIKQIKNTHGCQLVVNGIIPTIKYYLRLIENTGYFINHYVNLLETDKTVKFEHKIMWNQLISKI